MIPGDCLTIYVDPLTHRVPEGLARLERCLSLDDGQYPGGHLERWDVRFRTAHQTYERAVVVRSIFVEETPHDHVQ